MSFTRSVYQQTEIVGTMKRENEYFTVVFHGDIRKLNGNPLLYKTDFGNVAACGCDNAFAQIDDLERPRLGFFPWIRLVLFGEGR